MTRVVLDTNVYISAFLFGGKPALILDLIEDHCVVLYYSEPIRKEVEDVLADKFQWPAEMVSFASKPYWSIGLCIEPRRTIRACPDSDDDRILECAVESQANFIVTGDKHLLNMVQFEGIPILRPDQFLQAMKL